MFIRFKGLNKEFIDWLNASLYDLFNQQVQEQAG